MARKTAVVTIESPGRDQGKIFHLREMPASQAEAWGARLLLALSKAGVDVPDGFFGMGMAGIAVMGIKAMGGLSWDVAKPLLDEMMTCVRIQPGPSQPNVIRDLIEDDIEEVGTRIRLRDEVISLHINFSIRGFISDFKTIQAERAAQAADEMIENGLNTPTSSAA